MQIVCRHCEHKFDPAQIAGSDTCPSCGGSVDVAAQIAEMTGRDTEAEAAPPEQKHLTATDFTNKVLGDYEIVGEVSRGAMGVIYKARHKRLRRVVALKVMLAGEHASADQVARFEKEARAAAKLRHPNIVPIYEIGVEGGNRYFTMDFIEGETLDVLIARKDLSTRRSLEIITTAADALGYAHSRGVVHRDIKPSNLMIDEFGRPQIMDFGLAKQMDTDTQFTRTGTTIGTPSYMPPEQARGENRSVDQRSDVYSLGAVLYEMLTGRPPFTGETMMNIVMKVIHDEPTPVRKLNSKLHRDIQTIVGKAMDKDPRQRYQTMADFADDIRRYLAGEMINARPIGPIRRGWKKASKYKSTILVAVIITALFSIVSSGIFFKLIEQQDRAKKEAEEREKERQRLTEDQTPQWAQKFRDDFRAPAIGQSWKLGDDTWKIENGSLVVDSKADSYILLNYPVQGNFKITFTATPFTASGRIFCFLGNDPATAYRFSLNHPNNCLSLMRVGTILAELEYPALKPKTPYQFVIERREGSLSCKVTVDSETKELRYTDPEILKNFESAIFGFQTFGSKIAFNDLVVSAEEYPGERMSKLQSIDYYYFSRGQLDKALTEYQDLIAKNSSTPPGVLAEHNLGLIYEALSSDPGRERSQALKHYRNVELQSRMLTGRFEPVAVKNRQRIFFALSALGQYRPAAEQITLLCGKTGRGMDPGTIWQFPAILQRCTTDLALDAALEIMENVRFASPNATLKAQWQAAGARAKQNFSKAVLDVCTGFAEQERYEQMKRAYLALPDPAAVVAFENAITRTIEAGDAPSSLSLFLFCFEQKMKTPRLDQLSNELAMRFIELKQYNRILNIHNAYPSGVLSNSFNVAIVDLVKQNSIEEAAELFREACTRFQGEEKINFFEATELLMASYLSAGKFADVRWVYTKYGYNPRLTPKLIEAANGLASAGDLDNGYDLVEFIRQNLPETEAQLKPIAAKLMSADGGVNKNDKIIDLLKGYPSPQMTQPFIALVTNAVKVNDSQFLIRLIEVAIADYADNQLISSSARNVSVELIRTGEAENVAKAFEAAAVDKPSRAAEIRTSGGDLFIATGAYAQAVQAYVAASKTPNNPAAVSAMIRAAALHRFLGESDKERRIYNDILKNAGTAPEASIAKLMTGLMTLDQFRQSLYSGAAVQRGEGDFFIALATEGTFEARELLKRIQPNAWYSPLAQVIYAIMPEPAMAPAPEKKPAIDPAPQPTKLPDIK